jgi:hypothetical protein
LPLPIKILHVANVSRPACQKIRVQRNDHFRFIQPVDRIQHAPKRQLRAFARAIANRRLPLVPLRLRIQLPQRFDLCGKHGRRNRPGQNPQPGATHSLL